MKLSTILICLITFTLNLLAQSDENPGSQSLDDVIVKETFEAGKEEEKLPIFLKADFSNLVEIKERIHWSSVSWKSMSPLSVLRCSSAGYRGSFGSPSTRSAMMLRWICDVPAAMVSDIA